MSSGQCCWSLGSLLLLLGEYGLSGGSRDGVHLYSTPEEGDMEGDAGAAPWLGGGDSSSLAPRTFSPWCVPLGTCHCQAELWWQRLLQPLVDEEQERAEPLPALFLSGHKAGSCFRCRWTESKPGCGTVWWDK